MFDQFHTKFLLKFFSRVSKLVYVYCEGFRIGVAIYLYVEQLLFQGKMFTEIQGRRNRGALRGHRCPYIPIS